MVDPNAGKLVSKMLPKDIPISLHIEYMKGNDQKQLIAAMKNDLTTLKKWL
ncbi:MAG: hypothetical protein ACI9SQ_000199 [Rubritalea sp.]|jgi:hypothetical protein